jgi:muramoyltetrapeptide carboxypeptidase
MLRSSEISAARFPASSRPPVDAPVSSYIALEVPLTSELNDLTRQAFESARVKLCAAFLAEFILQRGPNGLRTTSVFDPQAIFLYDCSMRFPPLLAAGARVALIAPAGPLRDADELERAKANVRKLGWDSVTFPNAEASDGYLAGSDEQRARDLNAAIADRTIDAIWCLRGGYGAMRILDVIDYQAVARNPKPLIGYSDVTALHAAFGRLANIVTFHGPTARQNLPTMSQASLECAVASGGNPCGAMPAASTLVGGNARGRLVGGNLALLTALVGTPYAPDYSGAIVMIEDVNEAHYRIDRMLTTLRLSGAFASCAGIVFGKFSDVPTEFGDEVWTLQRVLADAARRAGVPCVSGAPFGHVDEQWTLPLGATAELDADARTLTVHRS